jgi:hypothetical protein
MKISERFGFLVITLVGATLGGAIAGYVVSAAAAGAAATPKLITAREFVLVDSHGAKRGEIGVTEKGVAQVALFDGAGRLRAGLGVAAAGAPGLGIYGKDGKTRIEIALGGGLGRVRLYDAKGMPAAALGVTPGGTPGLVLMDNEGRPRASLDVADDGAPTLRMGDATGTRLGLGTNGITRATLTVNQSGNGALTLFGVDGKEVTGGLP